MLMGRATATPQLKKIDSLNISVVNFTLATNRRYKNKDGNLLEDTEYHKCVAYEKQADLLATYLTKGKKLYVEGKLRKSGKTLKDKIALLQRLWLIHLFFWIRGLIQLMR